MDICLYLYYNNSLIIVFSFVQYVGPPRNAGLLTEYLNLVNENKNNLEGLVEGFVKLASCRDAEDDNEPLNPTYMFPKNVSFPLYVDNVLKYLLRPTDLTDSSRIEQLCKSVKQLDVRVAEKMPLLGDSSTIESLVLNIDKSVPVPALFSPLARKKLATFIVPTDIMKDKEGDPINRSFAHNSLEISTLKRYTRYFHLLLNLSTHQFYEDFLRILSDCEKKSKNPMMCLTLFLVEWCQFLTTLPSYKVTGGLVEFITCVCTHCTYDSSGNLVSIQFPLPTSICNALKACSYVVRHWLFLLYAAGYYSDKDLTERANSSFLREIGSFQHELVK